MTVANAIKENPSKALAVIKQAQDDESNYLSKALKTKKASNLLAKICGMTDGFCETDEDCAASAPIKLAELGKREKALNALEQANLTAEKKTCIDETKKSMKFWQRYTTKKSTE